MDKENNEVAFNVSPDNIKCNTCVWAFVFGCKPYKSFCGKFPKKPSKVYFKGANCPYYKELGKKDS